MLAQRWTRFAAPAADLACCGPSRPAAVGLRCYSGAPRGVSMGVASAVAFDAVYFDALGFGRGPACRMRVFSFVSPPQIIVGKCKKKTHYMLNHAEIGFCHYFYLLSIFAFENAAFVPRLLYVADRSWRR